MLWISFNGTTSDDYDIVVNRFTPPQKPTKRETRLVIPGRSGTLTIDDGTYEDITVTVEMTLRDIDRDQEIKDWLAGSGDLICSLRPDRKYRASVPSNAVMSYWAGNLYIIKVDFLCHPFQYEVTPEVLTTPATLYNSSPIDALPLITFTGSIVVNGVTFTAATELTVDADAMVIYKYVLGVLTAAGSDLTGDIESLKLVPGENTITGTAEIQPNWRWL